MARKSRIKSSREIYHVVVRGADRQLMFEEARDYQRYFDILEYYKEKCQFKLFAYCLMSNHVHLLIQTPNTAIDKVFRHINTSYSVWFNMKYQRTGALQQGRYYSEPINDDRYLITALRYIHLNPCKAGLEPSPGVSYLWNSYNDYQQGCSQYVDIDEILEKVGGVNAFKEIHLNSGMYDSEDCIDVHDMQKRLPDNVARQIIKDVCGSNTVVDFQKLSIMNRNKYLLLLHQKGLSIRQLNRLTGISKGIIDRVVTGGHSL